MPLDPEALELELDEARAAHTRLRRVMGERMAEIDDLWRQAKVTDRLLAVQRLIQTGALSEDMAARIETKNERVRAVLAKVRQERKALEQSPDDAELKHRIFRLELDMQRAEQERDRLIDTTDLRGPLYFCGETFVRNAPFTAEQPPLKDLATRVQLLEQRILDLQGQAAKNNRTGAKFIKVDDDGVERTLIRMLPALTLSGED